MSAEVLRRAASLMRERAEVATPGPWTPQVGIIVSNPGPNAKYVADCYDEPGGSVADAAHIASWHPAAALAVADVLSLAADHAAGRGNACGSCVEFAEAVARAYLGSDV